MTKDITEAELNRELARLTGRTLPATEAVLARPLAPNEDITEAELDVALARLTGRAVAAELSEAATRDAAARESASSTPVPRPVPPRVAAPAGTIAEAAARKAAPRTTPPKRHIVQIEEMVGGSVSVIDTRKAGGKR